jgi:hypothetical protein
VDPERAGALARSKVGRGRPRQDRCAIRAEGERVATRCEKTSRLRGGSRPPGPGRAGFSPCKPALIAPDDPFRPPKGTDPGPPAFFPANPGFLGAREGAMIASRTPGSAGAQRASEGHAPVVAVLRAVGKPPPSGLASLPPSTAGVYGEAGRVRGDEDAGRSCDAERSRARTITRVGSWRPRRARARNRSAAPPPRRAGSGVPRRR